MMKKYELVLDSSVEFMGTKLYQIRALIKFGNIEKGELGGYIATEKNLAQVSGNAWVSGDARVYGNDKLKITPINIIGLAWDVTITPTHMVIGCERHSHVDWSKFNTKRIETMSNNAVHFWKQHKAMLLALCKSHAKAKC